METALTALRACRLFASLSDGLLQETILPRGTYRVFAKNAALISPGDLVDWFAVVVEGRVHILQAFSDGGSSLMNSLLPGYVLGAELMCTESLRAPYSAQADADGTMLVFPRGLILEPGTLPEPERLQVCRALLTLLAQENMRKHYRLAILSRRGLRDRILTWLVMQVRRRGSRSFRAAFSREELADFLCVNRSALSHELARMEQDGLIRFRKNEFTLLSAGRDQSTWA